MASADQSTKRPNQARIREFWQRRDPTPDTAENEYKGEHYRRIAYANLHFAQNVPGWATARGQTYILYGPPDLPEFTPDAGDAEPTQRWHYGPDEQALDFVFVDKCSFGNYILQAPSPK